MKRFLIGLSLGIAFSVGAATNFTLSLSDDAGALAKWACSKASESGSCTTQEATAYASKVVDGRIVVEWRNQKAQADGEIKKDPTRFCNLFAAAPVALQNEACSAFGLANSCTPPGC